MFWLEGKKKLLFAALIEVGLIIALLMKVITPDQFWQYTLANAGIYGVGNGMEHIGARK